MEEEREVEELAKKIESLASQASEKPGSLFGSLRAVGGSVEEAVASLRRRIQELDKKLKEKGKPSVPPASPGPVSQAQAGGPASELTRFLESKVRELEKKLQETQEKALSSSILFREREEAQKKAQKEMEDFLKTVREGQRQAELDRHIQEQLKTSQSRIQDLEEKLLEQSRHAVAEETFLKVSEGLERRMQTLETEAQARAQEFETKLGKLLELQKKTQEDWAAKLAESNKEADSRFQGLQGSLSDAEERWDRHIQQGLQELKGNLQEVSDVQKKAESEWMTRSAEAQKDVESKFQGLANRLLDLEAAHRQFASSLEARDREVAERLRSLAQAEEALRLWKGQAQSILEDARLAASQTSEAGREAKARIEETASLAQELRQERAAANLEWSRQKEELSDFRSKLEVRQAELQAAQARTEEQAARLKDAIQKIEGQVSSLQSESTAAREAQAELKAEASKLGASLEAEQKSQAARLERLKEEQTSDRAFGLHLQRDLDALAARLQELRRELDRDAPRLEALEKGLPHLQAQIEQRVSPLESSLRDISRSASDIGQKAHSQARDIQELKASLEEKGRWLGAWQAHLQGFVADTKSALKDLESRLSAAAPVLARLAEVSARLDKAVEEVRSVETRQEGRAQQLAQTIGGMKSIRDVVGEQPIFASALQDLLRAAREMQEVRSARDAETDTVRRAAQDARLRELRGSLDRQMALVQAWLKST